MKNGRKRRMTLQGREQLHGYAFIAPWLVGLVFVFAVPLIMSVVFALNKVNFVSGGYALEFKGLENFRYALLRDADYPRHLFSSVTSLVYDVPVILVFSFFVALLLRKKFPGSGAVKAIFFLPIILSSGLFLQLQTRTATTSLDAAIGSVSENITVLKSVNMERYLLEMGIPEDFIAMITGPIDKIYNVISNSGIQIFIFLAGLNSISPSLYEAAHVEGGNGWEVFWKITFPMMTPLLLVNIIYSIVDSFTSVSNQVMSYVYTVAFTDMNFGLSNAMCWIYLLILAVFMAIVFAVVSRRIFYYT